MRYAGCAILVIDQKQALYKTDVVAKIVPLLVLPTSYVSSELNLDVTVFSDAREKCGQILFREGLLVVKGMKQGH